jgi:hypothetical protein
MKFMGFRSFWLGALAAFLWGSAGQAQVIEFESNGLQYETLTKSGVTIMFAQLPDHVRDYAILQVAVSNGSKAPWTIRPEDFVFERKAGGGVRAAAANSVVRNLIAKAGGSDVVHLITAYEQGLYGLTQFRSTNGYEQRRQGYLSVGGSAKFKAAAAASAIALVLTKLAPGESTDGAVFLPVGHKSSLGDGHLVVKAGGETFDFSR